MQKEERLCCLTLDGMSLTCDQSTVPPAGYAVKRNACLRATVKRVHTTVAVKPACKRGYNQTRLGKRFPRHALRIIELLNDGTVVAN